MTINSSTGAFSWTPSEAQGGLTPSVTMTVTDNGTRQPDRQRDLHDHGR